MFRNGVEIDDIALNEKNEVGERKFFENLSERTEFEPGDIEFMLRISDSYYYHREEIDEEYHKLYPDKNQETMYISKAMGIEPERVEQLNVLIKNYYSDYPAFDDKEYHFLCDHMELKYEFTLKEAKRYSQARKKYQVEYFKGEVGSNVALYQNLSKKLDFIEYIQNQTGYSKDFIERLEELEPEYFKANFRCPVCPPPCPHPVVPTPVQPKSLESNQ